VDLGRFRPIVGSFTFVVTELHARGSSARLRPPTNTCGEIRVPVAAAPDGSLPRQPVRPHHGRRDRGEDKVRDKPGDRG
jgi:hypothetical protein